MQKVRAGHWNFFSSNMAAVVQAGHFQLSFSRNLYFGFSI